MATDLLSTIIGELDARLSELRPSFEEYEQLLRAAAALEAEQAAGASVAGSRTAARGRRSASRAAGGSSSARARATGASRSKTPASGQRRGGARRATRGAAREAIVGALEHGSHTVSELVVVTAMTAANINNNVRRLLAEGALVKTEREGKTAYTLPG